MSKVSPRCTEKGVYNKMKCDACGFFDCGRDCRCKCHDKNRTEWEKADPSGMKPLKTYHVGEYSEKEAMSGLSSLFG